MAHVALSWDGSAKIIGAGLSLEAEATAATRENDVYRFGLLLLQLLNNVKASKGGAAGKTAWHAWQLASQCCDATDNISSALMVRETCGTDGAMTPPSLIK